MAYWIHSTYVRGGVTKGLLINLSIKEIFDCAKNICQVRWIAMLFDSDTQQIWLCYSVVNQCFNYGEKIGKNGMEVGLISSTPEPQMNIMINMRICVLNAGIKGRDKLIHPTVFVGCNYLSMPLIHAPGTQFLIW